MKKTPFNELHHALGAKMHEFAGYDMPIEYPTGIIEEHNTVVDAVGVFDVSHMGEFWVKGPKAKAFVQKVTTNDVNKLSPGKIQYTCFPNREGGIVDDLLLYQYEEEKFLMVVNAANMEKDWAWCQANNTEGAELENASDWMAQLAVQGPRALETIQKLTDVDLTKIPYYTFTTGKIADVDNVIISNSGYTGCGGFELYFYPQFAGNIWKALFAAGAEFGIKPIGLGARDTLRLEAGFPLYGHELSDETTPIQAGLGWITKLVEGNDFIGRSIIEAEKINGSHRKLVGFEMVGRGIPRQDYEVVNADGEVIGQVTSGTMSPYSRKSIGLAYVQPEYAALETTLFIRIRNKDIEAKVVKPPFREKAG